MLNSLFSILEQLEADETNEHQVEQLHETRIQELRDVDQLFKQESPNYIELKARYASIEGIQMEDLLHLQDKIKSIESSLAEKTKQLSSFQGLPSDMVLASLEFKHTQETLVKILCVFFYYYY